MAFSTNFDIEIPDDGGDFDQWGLILNAALGAAGAGPASGLTFDGLIKANLDAAAAAQAKADAALPLDGSAPMSGRLDSFTGSAESVDLAAGVGAVAMNMALANFFLAQPPTTPAVEYGFDVSSVPAVAPKVLIAFLSLFQGGAGLVSWDASINWPGGTAGPPLSTLGTDLLGFYTPDDGVTWYGSLAQSDVR